MVLRRRRLGVRLSRLAASSWSPSRRRVTDSLHLHRNHSSAAARIRQSIVGRAAAAPLSAVLPRRPVAAPRRQLWQRKRKQLQQRSVRQQWRPSVRAVRRGHPLSRRLQPACAARVQPRRAAGPHRVQSRGPGELQLLPGLPGVGQLDDQLAGAQPASPFFEVK